MKIRRLSLENFRQFYGAHAIDFSIDDIQCVTVIHGENGAGKTSLLNAFKWCFYGRTDFDTGERNILNEHAIAIANSDERIPLLVEVGFEHDGHRYVAKRTQVFRKADGMDVETVGGAVLELSWTDPSGAFDRSKNPESQMSQILPEKMHSYFFFNGERIEKLAYASASQEIREAIRTLMGLEIVERARNHLGGKIKKHFSKQIGEGASDELRRVIDRENEIDDEMGMKKNDSETERNNIQQFDADIQFINNKLKSMESTAHLQEEWDGINKRLDEIKGDLTDISVAMRQLIGDRGFLPFIHPVAQKVWSLLEERRKKGELPYQIKQQFIDDLLNREACICGTRLTKGGAAYAAVEQYKMSAASEGIEEAFINTSGALKQVGWSRDDLFGQLRERLAKRATLCKEKDKLLGRREDISKLLRESEIEHAAALEKKRADLHRLRDEAIGRKGQILGKLEDLEKDLNKVRERRKELTKKSGQADIAKRRHEIAEECARVLSELHDALSRRTRDQLSERVNDTFQKILKKDYWAEIDDDYCLQIFKNIPEHGSQVVYEKSTGESQVTSLSFIGSIVSLAKEQHAKERQFFRGGVFPIIMDSPFGSLDPTYRELIARYIPELADQIILLVSGTQWKGEVEKECQARVGKHVSLIYHAPEVGKEKTSYYVRPGADYEYTEFEEGYHG
jgi:DNA sulfur modification protein DndD